MEWVSTAALVIEGAGVAIILIGGLVATLAFLRGVARRRRFEDLYGAFRANLGRAILLGLEFLVAGDIIATILVEPTLQRVFVLAIVVLIRTFLSFSLETEIEGRAPWRRHEARAGG